MRVGGPGTIPGAHAATGAVGLATVVVNPHWESVMRGRSTLGVACMVYVCVGGGVCLAQSGDAMIDTIRSRTDIGESDQRRIADWMRDEIAGGRPFKEFRRRFSEQYNDAGNTQQFRTQFAVQATGVAAEKFRSGALIGDNAHAVAQALVDLKRIEVHPALLVCLNAADVRARYLCADGLVELKRQIASDNALFASTVEALREAGRKEQSGVVLGRIYDALAIPEKVGAVFADYVQLLDARLAVRRNGGAINGGPELYAFEFFRLPAVRNALDPNQKAQLVARLAVFLRLDAARYAAPNLDFNEIDRLERTLDAAEEILAALVPEGGGKIRDALSSGGVQAAPTVMAEVYRWIGDANANSPGALNQPPWNVAVGAP